MKMGKKFRLYLVRCLLFTIIGNTVCYILWRHYSNDFPDLTPSTQGPLEENAGFGYRPSNIKKLENALDQKLKKASKIKYNILYLEAPFGNTEEKNIDINECGRCEVVFDKSMINAENTKAVIFHYAELEKVTFPKTRRLDQYYVFQTMESSATMKRFERMIKRFDSVFNLTMTYRLDSDIWNPYGSRINAIKSAQSRPQVVPHEEKRKLALWVVSNCFYTKGAVQRMNYMKRLVKSGLRVDLAGKCHSNGVKDWNYKDYKFHFAFENSIHCKDYITEKFFRNSLRNAAVPVVFGTSKADYESIAPPNSFIYAPDYTDSELIQLLNYLDRNDTAYMEYLRWTKIPLETLNDRRSATDYCQLCRILHGINYDYIFHRNYKESFSNLQLFPASLPTRTVKSLSQFLFEEENIVCMMNTYTLLEDIIMNIMSYALMKIYVIALPTLIWYSVPAFKFYRIRLVNKLQGRK